MTEEAVDLVIEFCNAMADWHRGCSAQYLDLPEGDKEAWDVFAAERLRIMNELLAKYTTQKKPEVGFSFERPSNSYEVEIEGSSGDDNSAIVLARSKTPIPILYEYHAKRTRGDWKVVKRVARRSTGAERASF